MKKLLLLFAFAFPMLMQAQNFKWAQCSTQSGIEYLDVKSSLNGTVTILAERGELNYVTGTVAFYDAEGKDHIQELAYSKYSIIQFSPDGKLKWNYGFSGEDNRIECIAPLSSGKILCLVYVEPSLYKNPDVADGLVDEEYEEEITEEEEEELEEKGGPRFGEVYFGSNGQRKILNAGYHFLTLNPDGTEYSIVPVDLLLAEFDGLNLQSHPNGNVILSGFVEKGPFSSKIKTKVHSGGANFLSMWNLNGQLIWADVINSSSASCCSFYNEIAHVAVDADGTIYYAGTLYEGGVFGGKTSVVTTLPYANKSNSSDKMDVFLSSYDPMGKLNWVKAAGVNGMCQSLAVGSNGIYMSLDRIYSAKVFGEVVDTSDFSVYGLLRFDRSGKMTANRMSACPVVDFYVNADGSIDGMGYIYYSQQNKVFDEKIPYKKNDNFFFFSLDKDLKLIKGYGFDLLVGHQYEQHLSRGGERIYYMWGELFAGWDLDAKAIDPAFKAGKVSGGAAFVGRFDDQIIR